MRDWPELVVVPNNFASSLAGLHAVARTIGLFQETIASKSSKAVTLCMMCLEIRSTIQRIVFSELQQIN